MSFSVRTAVLGTVLVIVSITSGGCFMTDLPVPDPYDGAMDAMTGGDAGITDGDARIPDADAGTADAHLDADGFVPDGSELDASSAIDADTMPDGGGNVCGDCVSPSPCQEAVCSPTGCVFHHLPDGLSCGSDPAAICVQGSCVIERCGDGYANPAAIPSAEACDDGNAVDGDGCSPSCTSTELTPDVDPADLFSTTGTSFGHAVGVDGLGNVLAVYRRVSSVDERVVIRRLRAFGASIDAQPTQLDVLTVLPSFAEPTVVGLRDGGWVVAWTAVRGGSQDIVFRVISPEGVADYEVIANRQRMGDQYGVSAIALDDGFLLGWTDSQPIAGDEGSGVVVRAFGPDGIGRSNDVRIAVDRAEDERQLSLVSSGSAWLAAWQSSGFSTGYYPKLLARRFVGLDPLDAFEMPLAMNADVADLAADSMGRYGIVWRDFASDTFGDVVMTTLGPAAAWDGIVLPVSALPGFREAMPRIAATPADEFLVAWEDGPLGRIAFHAPTPSSFSASTTMLTSLLQQQAIGRLSLSSSGSGVWFAFDADRASQFEDSFTLFLEPLP